MSAQTFTDERWELPELPALHARVWRPEKIGDEAILFLHGVESHAGWFDDIAPLLVAKGITVYAVDRPGWGQSDGPRGHVVSYADLVRLFDRVVTRIRRDHLRLHLCGMSWGGKLALYLALRRPIFFDSLTMLAPGLFPTRGPGLIASAAIAAGWATRYTTLPAPLPIRDDEFTVRADRTEFIANDPHRVRRVTASFCVESLKMGSFIEQHISQLRLPWRLILAGDDTVIDNAATEKLFVRASGMNGQTLLLPGCRHTLVFENPSAVADLMGKLVSASVQPHPKPRRILVAGAGAVGSMIGGLLANAGHHVALLGRLPHITAVRDEGLSLSLGDGERLIGRNIHGITALNQLREPPELVFLTVKGFHTKSTAEELAAFLEPGVPVVSLQNGIDNERQLAETLAGHSIVAGSICAYLSFEGAGRVRWLDDLGGVALAPWTRDAAEGVALARGVLEDAGLSVFSGASGESAIWSKLMLNIAFNALNALTALGASEIMRDPSLAFLSIDAMRECVQVMRAKGITPVPLPGYQVHLLSRVVMLPRRLAHLLLKLSVKNDGGAKSSMAQDLARNRSVTEIDGINGVIVRAGVELGIPTPANVFLTDCVTRKAADPAFDFRAALAIFFTPKLS